MFSALDLYIFGNNGNAFSVVSVQLQKTQIYAIIMRVLSNRK